MSDTEFHVETVHINGEIVLALAGEIDTLSAPNLGAAAVRFAGEGMRLVFDLGGVTFMDSAGLSVIAGTVRRLQREGGSLCIRNARDQVRRLLEMTAIDQYVTIDYTPETFE
ncbi:MAG: STAS domain-containing protein [Ilumatobacteraceae bacterium]